MSELETGAHEVGARRETTQDGREAFRIDVLRALASAEPSIPCKYFYDERGSALFDRITEQPEYYPTRAEARLLYAHASAIAAALGPKVDLVELGSGSSIKTRILLDALATPRRYVPIDISAAHLRASASKLALRYPSLPIEPVVLDYTRDFDVPRASGASRRVVFFPGSSIGNFEPADAVALLVRARRCAGPGGVVLVGVDLPKDPGVLVRAYDDAAGVTAQFNLNVLHRMRNELDAQLEVDAFEHRAPWQPETSRIEMRLVARRTTRLVLGDWIRVLAAGEHLVTEHCYKHDVERFRGLARSAGLRPGPVFHDPEGLVSMHWLDATEALT